MTSNPERVAVIGTGLIGTSVALAATRVGCIVTGWDLDPAVASRATRLAGAVVADSLEECVAGAEIVVVAAPIGATAQLVAQALVAAPEAVVTDAASIKSAVVLQVGALCPSEDMRRFVPGHPMGGSERSGPEHASASLIDGIVWVLTPTAASEESCVERLQSWVSRLGARPVRMPAERHDRLVAFVSHLPQVASTALMGLAATEEADEPEGDAGLRDFGENKVQEAETKIGALGDLAHRRHVDRVGRAMRQRHTQRHVHG
jgi:prephenate dehydrogenase